MTTLEAQAKAATQEFVAWVKGQFGKPVHRTVQSAMFQNTYANGWAIDGWHGHKSAGYGELNVVMTVWCQSSYPVKKAATWERPFADGIDMCSKFTQVDLDGYRQFLSVAKGAISRG